MKKIRVFISVLVLLFAAFALLPFSVKADISFEQTATGTAFDANGDIAVAQTITITIASGDTILVMAWMHDCTAAVNMGIAVTDSGGNTYTLNGSFSRANCGTVDVFVRAFYSLNVSASASSVTITQTNPPASDYYAFAGIVSVYSGVDSFGDQFSGTQGSTAFPFVEVEQTEADSWIGALLFEDVANQAVATMNAGNNRGGAGLSGSGPAGRVMSFDNNATGGLSGGGHDCGANLCVLPNFGSAHTWYGYAIELIFEPVPPSPPIVTPSPFVNFFNFGWLLVFTAILTLTLIGAWTVTKKRR